MKLLTYLFLIILIKSVELRKYLRKYVLIRDEEFDKNGLSQFSILDPTEKTYLYRLKSSFDGSFILISYPSKEIVGYLDGDWLNEGKVNVSFDIQINDQWTNGTINKIFHLFIQKYFIKWNEQIFIMKKRLFSTNYFLTNENQMKLGEFRMRFRWFYWSFVKYELKIYLDNLPDLIYLFLILIQDHRNIIL